jgi:hypothetical protein
VNNEGSLFVEPYMSLYPNGTTEQQASDYLACPEGMFTIYATEIMLFMAYVATEAGDKHRAGVPVWRGRYFSVWPNLSPFPSDPSVGAYHGSDLPLTFGTAANVHLGNSTAKPTKAELTLSGRCMDAWLTFAEVSYISVLLMLKLVDLIHFQDPKDGLSRRLGWPMYDPSGNALVKIGENNSSSITFGPSTQYDTTCPK